MSNNDIDNKGVVVMGAVAMGSEAMMGFKADFFANLTSDQKSAIDDYDYGLVAMLVEFLNVTSMDHLKDAFLSYYCDNSRILISAVVDTFFFFKEFYYLENWFSITIEHDFPTNAITVSPLKNNGKDEIKFEVRYKNLTSVLVIKNGVTSVFVDGVFTETVESVRSYVLSKKLPFYQSLTTIQVVKKKLDYEGKGRYFGNLSIRNFFDSLNIEQIEILNIFEINIIKYLIESLDLKSVKQVINSFGVKDSIGNVNFQSCIENMIEHFFSGGHCLINEKKYFFDSRWFFAEKTQGDISHKEFIKIYKSEKNSLNNVHVDLTLCYKNEEGVNEVDVKFVNNVLVTCDNGKVIENFTTLKEYMELKFLCFAPQTQESINKIQKYFSVFLSKDFEENLREKEDRKIKFKSIEKPKQQETQNEELKILFDVVIQVSKKQQETQKEESKTLSVNLKDSKKLEILSRRVFETPNKFCSEEEMKNASEVDLEIIINELYQDSKEPQSILPLIEKIQSYFSNETLKSQIFLSVPFVVCLCNSSEKLKTYNSESKYTFSQYKNIFKNVGENLKKFLIFASFFFNEKNELILFENKNRNEMEKMTDFQLAFRPGKQKSDHFLTLSYLKDDKINHVKVGEKYSFQNYNFSSMEHIAMFAINQ